MSKTKAALGVAVMVTACASLATSTWSAENDGSALTGKSVLRSFDSKAYRPASTSKQSRLGERLFYKNQCMTCHLTRGAGGCLGPPLDGIGSRRNAAFILSRITNDSRSVAEFAALYGCELMPHPRLASADANAVTSFLMTLPEPVTGFSYFPHKTEPAGAVIEPASPKSTLLSSIAKGKKVYSDAGCASCHSIGGLGGTFAPALDNVGATSSRQEIVSFVSKANLLTTEQGEYAGRGNPMPPSGLSKDDVENIASFLMSLTTSNDKSKLTR